MKRLAIVTVCLLLSVQAGADPLITFEFSADKSIVGPAIGVTPNTLGHGYILVEYADMLLGGAAFRLTPQFQPGLLLLSPWTADGVVLGDLFAGVEIGLYDPVAQFGGDGFLIAGFDFLALEVGLYEFSIEAHPNYAAPMISNASGVLTPAFGSPGTIVAQPEPEVGIFFDPAGTTLEGAYNGGPGERIDAWVVVRHLDHVIDWMAFSLELPPEFALVGVDYAPEAVVLSGALPGDVRLDFTPVVEVPGDAVFVVAHLSILAGNQVVDSAVLRPGGYTPYESTAPILYPGALGHPYQATALVSTLSIPVANESSSWGRVKSLF